MDKKSYFYYVDEAGDLEDPKKKGASNYFIMGCIISDSPKVLLEEMKKAEAGLGKRAIFIRHKEQIEKEGIHACSNHWDIYNYMIERLIPMNFRAYLIVFDKRSEMFIKMIKTLSKDQIYDVLLKRLLKDRLLKRKMNENHIVIEQNFSKFTSTKKIKREGQIREMLTEINENFLNKGLIESIIEFNVELKDKKEPRLLIADYINHIVLSYFDKNNENHVRANFELIEHKIGLINLFDEHKYLKLRKLIKLIKR